MNTTSRHVATDVVRANLERLRDRITTAGGDPRRVTIVAVTKGFGPDAVAAALAVGLTDLGENYAQALIEKAAVAPPRSARWHFLGAVQRNKVARLAPVVSVWQGVDRVAAGVAIAKRSPGACVLVQVNVSGAAGRNGCAESDAVALVDALRRLGLDVAGFMAVASPGPPAVAHVEFERLAALGEAAGTRELSMGMSGDVEAAVRAGSTMVRVGTALFGDRPADRGGPDGRGVPKE